MTITGYTVENIQVRMLFEAINASLSLLCLCAILVRLYSVRISILTWISCLWYCNSIGANKCMTKILQSVVDDELFDIKLELGWFRYEFDFFCHRKWLFLYHSWEIGGEKNKFAIFLQLDFNGSHILIFMKQWGLRVWIIRRTCSEF